MTGAELRAHRLAAGLTQAGLAIRARIVRNVVHYWEAKAMADPLGWAPLRIAEVLGVSTLLRVDARARGWGNTSLASDDLSTRRLADEMARLAAREVQHLARRRIVCGAKTRKGSACRNRSEPGKQRCKFHGGKSTGPRTLEGRARIAEAQRRRWALWRASPWNPEVAIEPALGLRFAFATGHRRLFRTYFPAYCGGDSQSWTQTRS